MGCTTSKPATPESEEMARLRAAARQSIQQALDAGAAARIVEEARIAASQVSLSEGGSCAEDEQLAKQLADDEALVEAVRAQPLPAESTWHFNDLRQVDMGGAELEPLFAYTDLIDASWLLQLSKREVMPEQNAVVPPWQLVPPEAKVELATLRRSQLMEHLPIAVLSYGWAGRHHPDPTGEQLRLLVPILDAMMTAVGDGCYKTPVWGVVWDFMALPQRGYTAGYDEKVDDRTPYQKARFGKGLKGINVWYGAKYTVTLVCDWAMPASAENDAPISRRGWCIFERRLSSICKSYGCCLTLSKLPADGKRREYSEVERLCNPGRFPPLTPDRFEEMLCEGMQAESEAPGTGFRFTSGRDATEICIPQYRQGFLRLMSRPGRLSASGCGWGDTGAQHLAASLAFAHAAGHTSQADRLDLYGNQLTDAAVPPLLEALRVGALPELYHLGLARNLLTDAAVPPFAQALRAGPLPRGCSLSIDVGALSGGYRGRLAKELRAAGKANGVEVILG